MFLTALSLQDLIPNHMVLVRSQKPGQIAKVTIIPKWMLASGVEEWSVSCELYFK